MHASIQSWGRLLRVSLSPTAIADVLAGLVLAGAGHLDAASAVVLVAASLCVYHGGMALNDWADRETDARVRADRPIPSGRISARAALLAASAGLLAGPLLALSISPSAAAWYLCISLLVVLYDLVGRGPWLGPLLLGLCRMFNLAVGLVALQRFPHEHLWLWTAPLLYGIYVFTLSRLGRYEDGEAGPLKSGAPARALWLLAVLLIVVPCLPIPAATWPARGIVALLTLAAAFGLVKLARRKSAWQARDVMPAMGCALRRMLIFTASVACLSGTPTAFVVAGVVLLLYPVAWYLRGVFPPS